MSARIVCLVPSLTELLFQLGLKDQLVGRTDFCIHPRGAVDPIAKVGGTKNVRFDRVRALRPTHVIVNVDENRAEEVDQLRSVVPELIVTHPNSPQDNLALYRDFGERFGAAPAARRLRDRLEAELARCAATHWPVERVLYLVWRDPWMSVASDTYIAATLATVGWQVIHGPGGDSGAARYPQIDRIETAAAQADRILLSTEPYPFTAIHVAKLQALLPGRPVQLLDGEMTGWYGSRTAAGLAYLRSLRTAPPI
ncbi:MAG: helical backbone metal receptor [Burkholderiaceae bacterium]